MRLSLWLIRPALVLAAARPSHPNTGREEISAMDHVNEFYADLGLSHAQVRSIQDDVSRFPGAGLANANLMLACAAARAALGADQVDTSPLDQAVIAEQWSQACIATPYCIFQPASTAAVSKAVKIINYYNIKFAVRSGGHSPNPGWSSVGEGGVLLDLQKLDSISLAADKKTVKVGPGARWGEVVDKLDAQQVTVVGGRIPIVGVAGLILGGGLHHLFSEYGTAADNVKNFEIVLADGSINNANAKENTDLFWALKGGGPNFGIVTSFELYTVSIPQIWYELRVYAVEDLSKVVDAHVKWHREGSSDVKGTASLIMNPDALTVLLQYSAPVERPAAFAPFYALEPLTFAVPSTIGTFSSLTAILASVSSPEPMRHDYRAVSSRIDAQLYKDVYNFWRPKAIATREATGANQTFTIQPVTINAVRQGEAKGGNPLGIPAENHIWWTTLVDWRDAKDDQAVRSVSIETTEKWKSLGKARGSYLPFLFMNDAARDQNPLASYGANNLNKLKAIAQKYDTKGLFQKQQNGGFLLSRA